MMGKLVQTWLTFKTSITLDLFVVTIRQLTTVRRAQLVFHWFYILPRNSVILKSYILFSFYSVNHLLI